MNKVDRACSHEVLRFIHKSGCYYLQCPHCGNRWSAIDANDHPRHEALLEHFGTSEDRCAPFYIRPTLQAHRLQAALSSIKIDKNLNVNIDELVTMLYQRPQAEITSRFNSEIASRYHGKPASASTKLRLMAETRDFLTRLTATYSAR